MGNPSTSPSGEVGAHTPGPWVFGGPVRRESVVMALTGQDHPNGLSESVFEVGQEGDNYPPGIAVVNEYRNHKGERFSAEANARLMAASPDLLEACKLLSEAQGWAGDDVRWADVWKSVRAAISKATK